MTQIYLIFDTTHIMIIYGNHIYENRIYGNNIYGNHIDGNLIFIRRS